MINRFSRREILAITAGIGVASCVENNGFSSPVRRSGVSAQPVSWTSGVAIPEPTQEIYPCRHDGAIHLVGGFVAENGQISGPTFAHYAWRPGDETWTEAAPLPSSRHHPQLISWRGGLFAFAGFESHSTEAIWVMQSSGYRLLGEVFPVEGRESSFEPAWYDVSALPVPCGEAVLGVTGDGLLHLAGGRTPRGEANAVWRDHIDTDHHFVLSDLDEPWQSAAPCLTKRNSAAGDVIAGNLHIVGGRTVDGGNVATHEVYDHREDRWREAAPMPQAQGGLAAAAVGNKLYVFGGEYFDNGGGVYPESWVYDTTTDRWESLPDMPHPRHGLGAVALNNEIYTIGGALEPSGVRTSALVEVLSTG